jgi:hypothetical protein
VSGVEIVAVNELRVLSCTVVLLRTISDNNAEFEFTVQCGFGDRGSTVVKVLLYKSEGRWFDPRWWHGILHWHKFLWSHYGRGVVSAYNSNEYQVYFMGGKCGRYLRLTTLPPSCAVFKKYGNLNFLEPSGPLEACNETALPYSMGLCWADMD